MRVEKFNAEAALRVGLAARQFPEMKVAMLIDILIRAVGYPLSCERLAGLTKGKMLRASHGHLQNDKALSIALDYLQGKRNISGIDLPAANPAAGNMHSSIRVAFASDYYDLIDSAFSGACRFMVYQVSPTESHLIAERTLTETSRFKNNRQARIALLKDCQMVCAPQFGSRNTAQLVELGIHPLACSRGQSATSLIRELQKALQTPPPWLAKYVRASA